MVVGGMLEGMLMRVEAGAEGMCLYSNSNFLGKGQVYNMLPYSGQYF